MRLAGIGDNVVDCYIEEGIMFPGGNALNVAVAARRSGREAGYIGVVGDDRAGAHIRRALEEEGVETTRLHGAAGRTAYATVRLVDSNRVFGRGSVGVSRFDPDPEDMDYLRGFDVIHTGDCSSMERHLHTLAGIAPLSFDFSDKGIEYAEPLLSDLWMAEFSGSHLTETEAEDMARWAHERGPAYVLVTLGSQGSLFYDGTRLHRQESVDGKVVDTLGAGDSFIARTIVGIAEGNDVAETLHDAAHAAYEACLTRGAFGYPAPSVVDAEGIHQSEQGR